MEDKTCRRCEKTKPLNEFGVNNFYLKFGAKDGRAITCKQCNREITAALRVRSWEIFRTSNAKVSRSLLGMK